MRPLCAFPRLGTAILFVEHTRAFSAVDCSTEFIGYSRVECSGFKAGLTDVYR